MCWQLSIYSRVQILFRYYTELITWLSSSLPTSSIKSPFTVLVFISKVLIALQTVSKLLYSSPKILLIFFTIILSFSCLDGWASNECQEEGKHYRVHFSEFSGKNLTELDLESTDYVRLLRTLSAFSCRATL